MHLNHKKAVTLLFEGIERLRRSLASSPMNNVPRTRGGECRGAYIVLGHVATQQRDYVNWLLSFAHNRPLSYPERGRAPQLAALMIAR